MRPVNYEGKLMGKRRTLCTHHCASCNRCFHSLSSFDCHLRGRAGDRKCVDPKTVSRLVPKTDRGYCELRNGYVVCAPVTIWTLKGSRAGAADRLSRFGAEADAA